MSSSYDESKVDESTVYLDPETKYRIAIDRLSDGSVAIGFSDGSPFAEMYRMSPTAALIVSSKVEEYALTSLCQKKEDVN